MRKLPSLNGTTPRVVLIYLRRQFFDDKAAKDRKVKGQKERPPTFGKIYANFSFHDDPI